MPSWFAASMTVLPFGTCTARPSISMFSMSCGRSDVLGNNALLVMDVMLEFAPEVLDEAFHGERRRIAERADRPALDVVRDGIQKIEILEASLAILDALHHAIQPARALTARRALPARLLEVEIREPHQALHHAARVVDDDHRARAQHRAGF